MVYINIKGEGELEWISAMGYKHDHLLYLTAPMDSYASYSVGE